MSDNKYPDWVRCFGAILADTSFFFSEYVSLTTSQLLASAVFLFFFFFLLQQSNWVLARTSQVNMTWMKMTLDFSYYSTITYYSVQASQDILELHYLLGILLL